MQLPSFGEIALPLGAFQLGPRLIQLLLDVPCLLQRIALVLPLRRHRRRLLLQARQLFLQPLQPVLAGGIILFLQSLRLDLQLQDLPVQSVQLLGLRIHLHPQTTGGLVHQVNRLVRQKPVGDIAMAQCRRRHQSRVRNPHPVVKLIFLLDPAQDADRIFNCRLRDHHRLKPPRQSRVLLHILAVFIQRSGPHAVQIPARQSRLDQVGGIHSTIGFAGTHQRVHLVDEQDDLAIRIGHLVQDGFQAFLKLAAIFGACNQGTHVQRHQLFIAQALGHVAIDDAQGQPFGNRGFADARLADQHRIVLGPTRQYLHRPANFIIAPDDRVDLAVRRSLGQIPRVFLQRVIAFLSRGCIGSSPLANIIDRRVQLLRRHSARIQSLLGLGGHQTHRHQNPLNGHKAVARLLGNLLRLVQNPHQRGVHERLRIARHLGHLGQSQSQSLHHPRRFAARPPDQVGRQPLLVIHQRFEQMLRRQSLVAFSRSNRLRRLDKPPRPFGEFLNIHCRLLIGTARTP